MTIVLTGRSQSKYCTSRTTIKALLLFLCCSSIIRIFVFYTSHHSMPDPSWDEIINTPTNIGNSSSHSKVSEQDYSTAATVALQIATAIIQNVSFDLPTISLESSKGKRERERESNTQHSDHRMTLLLLHYPFFIMFSFLIQAMCRSPILFCHNK